MEDKTTSDASLRQAEGGDLSGDGAAGGGGDGETGGWD